MAIGIMKRFTIVAHKEYREEIITKLRTLGITEIEFKDKTLTIAELKDLEKNTGMLEFSIAKLKEYSTSPVAKEKIFISKNQLQNLITTYNIEEIYNYIAKLSTEIDKIKISIQTQENKINSLKPWRTLNKNFSELADTQYIKFFFCSTKQKKFEKLKEKLKDKLSELVLIQEYEKEVYFIVISFVEDELQIKEYIKQLGITTYSFELIDATPQKIISNLNKEIMLNQKKLSEFIHNLKNIAQENLSKLLALYDYYSEVHKIKSAQEKLQYTQQTFIIEGWVPEFAERKLSTQLTSISDAIEIYSRYPAKNEIPPIILKNTPIISPFEFLTTLFDRPQYSEFDPTPLFSPFFIVFVALCISDIFYGIIATVLSLIGLHILSKKPGFTTNSGSYKLLKIVLFCGLLTTIFGIFTNSIAGFPIANVFNQLKKFVIINPLQEPIKLLIISLLLGIIQLIFGMCIKLVKNFKLKDFFGVIDQLLLIVLTIFVIPLAYMFMFGKIISEQIVDISKSVFPITGILFLVFTIGRKLITKPIDSISTVFSTIGLFGDTLSYSRIFGLALSGAAIAQIVNSGVVALAGNSYAGYILAGLLFVFGHSVNFLMNILGAFVHSARLQFLEFFSKFFDGGGKAFQPFCQENKYTIEI